MLPTEVKQVIDQIYEHQGLSYIARKERLARGLQTSGAGPHLPEIIQDLRHWEDIPGSIDRPIGLLLDVLAQPAPRELIPIIGDFLNSDNGCHRRDAAFGLGMFGRNEGISFLRRALVDPDEFVVSAAITGSGYGGEKPDCDPEFRKEMFAAILPFLDLTGLCSPCRPAMYALIHLDRERACDILLNRPYFTADYPNTSDIIQCFEFFKIELPTPRLETLREEQRQKSRAMWIAAGMSPEEVHKLTAGANLPVNPKTFEDLRTCLLNELGGEDAFKGDFGDLSEDMIEEVFEKLLRKLAALKDERVPPLLRQVACWIMPPATMWLHRALSRSIEKKTLAGTRTVDWSHGLQAQLSGAVVRGEFPVTDRESRVGEWEFASKSAAKSMFACLKNVAHTLRVVGEDIAEIVFYFAAIEDTIPFTEASEGRIKGPAISGNGDYIHD